VRKRPKLFLPADAEFAAWTFPERRDLPLLKIAVLEKRDPHRSVLVSFPVDAWRVYYFSGF
jgi:hypothetical protein